MTAPPLYPTAVSDSKKYGPTPEAAVILVKQDNQLKRLPSRLSKLRSDQFQQSAEAILIVFELVFVFGPDGPPIQLRCVTSTPRQGRGVKVVTQAVKSEK
jgi:hypothetical protein